MSKPSDQASPDVEEMARDLKAQVEADARGVAEQLDLIPDVDAVVEARERLGENAGQVTLVREAGKIMRERRGGRPRGVRNKRTIEFRKFLLDFGPHPLVQAMKVQGMDPVELIEKSMEIDPSKRRMTLAEAMGLQARARELIAPYVESKMPVAVAHAFHNLPDLIIEGLTHSSEAVRTILDAEPLPFDDDDDDADEGDE